MFNPEQTILEWRRQMIAAGIKTPVPLNELESHLRDEMEQQMRSGLSAKEAFDIARQAIGQAHALKGEFEKVSLRKEARKQKLLRTIFLIFGSFYCLFVITVVVFKLGSFATVTPTEQALSLAALAFTVLLCSIGFFARGFFPVIPEKRIRTAVCVSGGVLMVGWLVIFYHVVLMRFDFTISQLVVACLWGMSPVGAFAALTIGLDHVAVFGNGKAIRES